MIKKTAIILAIILATGDGAAFLPSTSKAAERRSALGTLSRRNNNKNVPPPSGLTPFEQFKDRIYFIGDKFRQKSSLSSSSRQSKIVDGYAARIREVAEGEKTEKGLLKQRGEEDDEPMGQFDLRESIYDVLDTVQLSRSNIGGPRKSSRSPVVENIKPVVRRDDLPLIASNSNVNDNSLPPLDAFKERAYTTGDSVGKTVALLQRVIQRTAQTAQSMPRRIRNTVRTVQSIPGTVKKAAEELVETVTRIPQRLEAIAFRLQNGATETVESVRRTVDDIQDTPARVKQNIQATQQAIQETTESIQDISANVAVKVGLKKPQPRPPKSPPPVPKTWTEIGLKLTGSLAWESVKGAAWVGNETAYFLWSQAMMVQEKRQQRQKEKRILADLFNATETSTTFVQTDSSQQKLASMDDDELENEIAEALQLAEKALGQPTTPQSIKQVALIESIPVETNDQVSIEIVIPEEENATVFSKNLQSDSTEESNNEEAEQNESVASKQSQFSPDDAPKEAREETAVRAVMRHEAFTSPVSVATKTIPKATSFYRKTPLLWNTFTITAILYSVSARLLFSLFRPLPFLKRLVPKTRKPSMASVSGEKVAVVTGCSTGIGFETAVSLLSRGYQVVVAVRSEQKGRDTILALEGRVPAPNRAPVFIAPLDLADLQSIQKFCRAISEKYTKIDVIVNNAGRNTNGEPVDGLDLCFLTNYLGHFQMTNTLIPLLLASGAPRVINLSSVMHHFCGADRHDESYWNHFALFGADRIEKSYSPSKLAMLYFTVALNQRFKSKGLRSIAVNPGAVNSDIWRDKPRWMMPLFRLLYLTNIQGCQTTVAACVEDLPDDVIYLQPYWQRISERPPWPPTEMLGPYVGFQAVSPRLPVDGGILSAEALWRCSEDLSKIEEPSAVRVNDSLLEFASI